VYIAYEHWPSHCKFAFNWPYLREISRRPDLCYPPFISTQSLKKIGQSSGHILKRFVKARLSTHSAAIETISPSHILIY